MKNVLNIRSSLKFLFSRSFRVFSGAFGGGECIEEATVFASFDTPRKLGTQDERKYQSSEIRKKFIIFLLSIATQAFALDFQTDPICTKLKTAIEQAQSLEKVQETWNGVTAGLSKENSAQPAQQATTYAQEQKQALEQIVTALGDKNYDTSKLKWGAAQMAFGLWCVVAIYRKYIGKWMSWWTTPIVWFFAHFRKSTTIDNIAVQSAIIGLLINYIATPYCSYKGIKNLYQGLHYKQSLETKIKNLTATIEFLQPLARLP